MSSHLYFWAPNHVPSRVNISRTQNTHYNDILNSGRLLFAVVLLLNVWCAEKAEKSKCSFSQNGRPIGKILVHSQTWVLLRKITKTTATITSEQSQRLKMIRTCSLSMNSNAILIRLYFCEFHFGYSSFFSASYANAPQSPKSIRVNTVLVFLLCKNAYSKFRYTVAKWERGNIGNLKLVKESYWFFFWCICWFGFRSVCSCRASRSISFNLKYVSSFHANVFHKLH